MGARIVGAVLPRFDKHSSIPSEKSRRRQAGPGAVSPCMMCCTLHCTDRHSIVPAWGHIAMYYCISHWLCTHDTVPLRGRLPFAGIAEVEHTAV